MKFTEIQTLWMLIFISPAAIIACSVAYRNATDMLVSHLVWVASVDAFYIYLRIAGLASIDTDVVDVTVSVKDLLKEIRIPISFYVINMTGAYILTKIA